MLGSCGVHPDRRAAVVESTVGGPRKSMCGECWDDHKINVLRLGDGKLVKRVMDTTTCARVFVRCADNYEHNGIVSIQYKVNKKDWEDEVRIMQDTYNQYVQMGMERIVAEYEELVVDGNPVYHLDTGPKNVKCCRRQNGLWLEGVHHRGHCPALIYGEEIEVMAKANNGNKTKNVAQKRKAEVPTAKLGPKNFVADPEPTKTRKQKKAEPRPCACQCGQMTGGGYFFPGHDAKIKSLFKKVSEGKMLKKDVHATVLKMYAIWDRDKSTPVKDIAKQILG